MLQALGASNVFLDERLASGRFIVDDWLASWALGLFKCGWRDCWNWLEDFECVYCGLDFCGWSCGKVGVLLKMLESSPELLRLAMLVY